MSNRTGHDVRRSYDDPFVILHNADLIHLMSVCRPTTVNVFLALHMRANRSQGNSCFPSLSTIAKDASVSRRTVISAIEELQREGFITVESRVDDQGDQASNLYWLHRVSGAGGSAKLAGGGAKSAPRVVQNLHHGVGQNLHPNHMNYSEPEEKEPYTPHSPQGGDMSASDVSDTPGDDTAEEPKPKRRKAGELLPEDAERFDRWWGIYPRKEAKATARRAWDRIRPDDDLTDQMITAVAAQAKAKDWSQPDQRQFIPLPASWLNAERWNDEVPVAGAGVTVETRPVGSTGRYTPTRDNSREAARQRALSRATPEWTRERLAEAGLPVTEQQRHEYDTGAADTRWRDVLTGEQMEALNAAFRRLVNLEMTALG